MTLIKSISGIRGTIGGKEGEGLSPIDVVKYASAFSAYLKSRGANSNNTIVVGRDARISGPMVEKLVEGAIIGMGINVVNIGMATTPTTEIAVTKENAMGGLIITASHNPAQWNALKLLNEKGEFLNGAEGAEVLKIAEEATQKFSEVFELGKVIQNNSYNKIHIEDILKLELVDVNAIRKAGFKVAIDCVNSVGGVVIPELLSALGVSNVLELYCEPNGDFPHNPEPLPENLKVIADEIKAQKADVGFVVDPDVDRLAIVCEDGTMFGEEYTLVAIADYILGEKGGNTSSNLSSSRALRDVTLKHGYNYEAAAVGEINVVEKMKSLNAIVGGEGNGGIILPELHYGRDALVGIALFLTYLAKRKVKVSDIKAELPEYHMSKNKIVLTDGVDIDALLKEIQKAYASEDVTTIDGVKIDFMDSWVHLRKSNTEPIIRVYSEAGTKEQANQLAKKVMDKVESIVS